MHKVTFSITPNPRTYLFTLPQTGIQNMLEFCDSFEADASPLAKKIFGFPWTEKVLMGANFISVTKQDWVEWDILAEPLSNLIQEHVDMNMPFLVNTQSQKALDEGIDPSDSELVKKIKKVLSREIRPVLALDGGDVKFVGIEGEILYVSLKGACSSCPSSRVTLKQGIEVRIKELFSEIKAVEMA